MGETSGNSQDARFLKTQKFKDKYKNNLSPPFLRMGIRLLSKTGKEH